MNTPIRVAVALVPMVWSACASAPTGERARPGPAARPAPAARAASGSEPATVTVRGPGKITTLAGATLDVPPGFVAHRRGRVVSLDEPDGVAKVALVELPGADCAAAVVGAWKLVEPGFAQKLERELRPPARDGYDAIYVADYARRKDGRRFQAVGKRKGKTIWVTLVRGTAPSLDKRGAQLRAFVGSLKAPGVVEQDLSKKTPRAMAELRAPLTEFVKRAVEATETPGLALAVVQDGKISFAEGFGVRRIGDKGRSRPITADTLMMIGSVTKSMTTLMMARLVDEKRLSWEGPVVEVDPKFRLADEQLTRKLTVEQLVCACAGLPRKDLPLILEFARKGAGRCLLGAGVDAPLDGAARDIPVPEPHGSGRRVRRRARFRPEGRSGARLRSGDEGEGARAARDETVDLRPAARSPRPRSREPSLDRSRGQAPAGCPVARALCSLRAPQRRPVVIGA